MATRRKNNERGGQQAPPPAPRPGLDALGLATLGGTIAILMISFSNMRSIDRVQSNLDNRLGQLEQRVAQAAAAPPAQPAQQQQQQRRRPDPEKVYEIKTASAPAKGPAGAPIVIAEFSDFQ